MINLFEIFYDSGSTFAHCLQNGPAAIEETLTGCSDDELKALARGRLAFLPVEIKGMDHSQLIATIVTKVVKVASRGRAMGDY